MARDTGIQVGTIYSDTLDDTVPTYIEMIDSMPRAYQSSCGNWQGIKCMIMPQHTVHAFPISNAIALVSLMVLKETQGEVPEGTYETRLKDTLL